MMNFIKIFAPILLLSSHSLIADVVQIEVVTIEPSSESENVLDSLPFKKGDIYEPRFVSISDRLLKATEKFDAVEVEWRESNQEFYVRVSTKEFFESISWRGDRVAERSTIERNCVLPNESINLSQERLSQINRCASGELQATGYLDAQVIIATSDKNLEFEAHLGKLYTVQNIEVQGISSSLQKSIIRQLFSEVGKPFRPLKVKDDTLVILRNLLREGYYFGEVYQPLLQIIPADHSVSLSWKVNLGEHFDIRFLGEYLSKNPLNEMLAREETLPKWFLEEIQDIITGELRADGFLDSEVSIRRSTGTGGDQTIKVVTLRGKRYELLSPDLIGVSDQKKVLSVIKSFSELRSGAAFNREKYKSTVNEAVGSALFEAGYLDVQIRGIDFTIDKEKARVRPVIYMSEGELYKVRSFKSVGVQDEFKGLQELKDFQRASREGRIFNQPLLERLKTELARSIVSQGFLDSKVDLSFQKSREQVDIELKIVPGSQYRVAQILVRGANRTKDRILRDEAGLDVGDIYYDDAVREGVANILRLGIARSVDIRVLEKDPDTGVVYVLIDIVEAARFRFEIGPGYGTLDGI